MKDKMEIMEPGEFEMRKVFEETTTKNVKTVIDYTTQTRDLMRELEKTVKELKNMLVMRDKETTQFKQQISIIQSKLYTNGTP